MDIAFERERALFSFRLQLTTYTMHEHVLRRVYGETHRDGGVESLEDYTSAVGSCGGAIETGSGGA